MIVNRNLITSSIAPVDCAVQHMIRRRRRKREVSDKRASGTSVFFLIVGYMKIH